MLRCLAIVFAFTHVLSCSDKTPGSDGCQSNEDCASGQICNAGVCEELCSADSHCGAGRICIDSLCKEGTRENAPGITLIDGDGGAICPDAAGSHCVLAGLVVEGTYLQGATFTLAALSGPTRTLAPRPGTNDARTELDLPYDIPPGVYTLDVANGVGSANQSFELIQGPAGPPGADGSPDTATEVLAKLLQVDGPSSGLDADTLDGVELSALLDRLVPVGTVVPFAGATIPDGWLLCDGAEVNRGDYTDLFAAIGVAHGGGDLVATFHLPDLRGRFVRGTDMGTNRDPDATSRTAPATGGDSGDAVGSVQDDQFQTHIHQARSFQRTGSSEEIITANSNFTNVWTDTSEPTTGTHGAETRPKNVYLNYIIKY